MRLVIGVGEGFKKGQEGVVGIDILHGLNPDIQCDIRQGIPPKFEDNVYDEINCEHVMEHIQLNEDFIFVMTEMLRVLKPGGVVYIEVPHKDSDAAYESIEHTRYFTENTFMNFYDNRLADVMHYPKFELVKKEVGQRDGHKTVCIWLRKPSVL